MFNTRKKNIVLNLTLDERVTSTYLCIIITKLMDETITKHTFERNKTNIHILVFDF